VERGAGVEAHLPMTGRGGERGEFVAGHGGGCAGASASHGLLDRGARAGRCVVAQERLAEPCRGARRDRLTEDLLPEESSGEERLAKGGQVLEHLFSMTPRMASSKTL